MSVSRPQRVRDLLDLERHAEASRVATLALVEQPEDLELLLLLGWAQYGLGELDAAIITAESAIGCRPGHPEAHRLLTYIHLALGDTEQALRAARATAALAPLDAMAQAALAEAALAHDEADAARDAARTALALQPDNPTLMVILGTTEAAGGAADRAADHFQDALAADPGHAGAMAHLALHTPGRQVFRRLRRAVAALRLDPQLGLATAVLDELTLFLLAWCVAVSGAIVLVGVVGSLAGVPALGLAAMGVALAAALGLWSRLPRAFRRSRRSGLRAGFGSWPDLWFDAAMVVVAVIATVLLASGVRVSAFPVVMVVCSTLAGLLARRWREQLE